MNKKDILIIISVIAVTLIVGGIFLYVEQNNKQVAAPLNTDFASTEMAPTNTVPNTRSEEQKAIDAFCSSSTYVFLDLKFFAHVECDYLDMCSYFDIESAMKWMKEKYGKDMPVCDSRHYLWKEWSHVATDALGDYDTNYYISEAYIGVRTDFYEAMKGGLNKRISLDSGLIFDLTKALDKFTPYLLDDKYCEKSSDCFITDVGCTKGSYNKYSNHIFGPYGCEYGIESLRPVSNSMYYDEKYKQDLYKPFTTVQLGCVKNKCEEKYILDETGEEF